MLFEDLKFYQCISVHEKIEPAEMDCTRSISLHSLKKATDQFYNDNANLILCAYILLLYPKCKLKLF